jgi:hypothetical protein
LLRRVPPVYFVRTIQKYYKKLSKEKSERLRIGGAMLMEKICKYIKFI